MISKNVKYGISENVTVADFGTGDIIVADGYIEEENRGCLMLANDVPNKISTDHPERYGKSTDELKQDVIFTFTNTDSIDVIIGALQTVKENMISKSALTKTA